jgi:phosphoribosylglycinamide formyltransferase-1
VALTIGEILELVKVAIFASGEGSNAEQIWRVAKTIGISVELVICDKEQAPVLVKAKRDGLKALLVEKGAYEKKHEHELRILKELAEREVKWVILAGYMRILSGDFLRQFGFSDHSKGRVLNIHPSLLPDFKGANAYRDAFLANVPISGVSVHFVTEGIDEGPILLQKSFERRAEDSLEDFIARGKKIEHEIYPEAIAMALKEGV